MKHWDKYKAAYVDVPEIDSFISDIIEVYKKHNKSIAHEDTNGAFIIEEYKDLNAKWLRDANVDLRTK